MKIIFYLISIQIPIKLQFLVFRPPNPGDPALFYAASNTESRPTYKLASAADRRTERFRLLFSASCWRRNGARMGPQAHQRRESCIDYLQVSIDLRCNLPTYVRLLCNPTSLRLAIKRTMV
jgi:hypothetical protein